MKEKQDMLVKGIFLSWIVVKDIKKAIEFYTHVVGLTLLSFEEQYGWAELSGPEGTLLGMCQENPEYQMIAGRNAVVTVTVDDIEVAREEVKRKGGQLIGDVMEVPGHVKLQTFLDSDHNMLQLVQDLSCKAV